MKYLFAAVLAWAPLPASARRKPQAVAALAGIVAPMAAANPIAVLWWWRRVWWRRRSSLCGPVAAAPTAPCGVTAVAALTDISKARQKPRSRGAFLYSLLKRSVRQAIPGGYLPVATTTPVAAAPTTAAMPAPMPAAPTAAAPVPATPAPAPSAPAAMTAAAPAHFFRREAIDLLARSDGRLCIRIDGKFGIVGERRRHQRRGLRTRCKRDAARGKSKGEFQKVAAFHHISSSVC
jgi:hypothetical protein